MTHSLFIRNLNLALPDTFFVSILLAELYLVKPKGIFQLSLHKMLMVIHTAKFQCIFLQWKVDLGFSNNWQNQIGRWKRGKKTVMDVTGDSSRL